LRLSQAIRDNNDIAVQLADYSRDSYSRVGSFLAAKCDYDDPLTALERVCEWADTAPGIKVILKEKETFDYDPANLVVRVLFSH
jgi:hypothetical protein